MSIIHNCIFRERLKALIKYKNFHLYPTELEAVIAQIPGVKEVCVFGIHDPLVQERVAAAVVKTAGSNVTEEDIIGFVDEKVDDFKRIRGGVFFVDTPLPRTMVGKLRRKDVRELLGQ